MSLSAKRLMTTAAVALVALIAALVAAELIVNPWRGSDANIRARLLRITPLSTRFDDVQLILDQRGWHQSGYQQTLPAPAQKPFLGGRVGGYQGLPWYVNVSAFWEFDESGRLRDITIERTMDSP
jgi:hypothetical protein